MAIDFTEFFASMTRAFKAVPPDKLADLQDVLKAGTAEPSPWRGVGASGTGAERTIAESSPDANHGDPQTRMYTALAALMHDQMKRTDDLEKARAEDRKAMRTLGRTVAMLCGVGKADGIDLADSDDGDTEVHAPDWEATGARAGKNPDGEVTETPATKSLSEIFRDLHDRAAGTSRVAKTGLTQPPSFAPAMAKSHVDGPSDSEIEAMSPADSVQALMERQRNLHRVRLGLV
jgi:hypothetical protein